MFDSEDSFRLVCGWFAVKFQAFRNGRSGWFGHVQIHAWLNIPTVGLEQYKIACYPKFVSGASYRGHSVSEPPIAAGTWQLGGVDSVTAPLGALITVFENQTLSDIKEGDCSRISHFKIDFLPSRALRKQVGNCLIDPDWGGHLLAFLLFLGGHRLWLGPSRLPIGSSFTGASG